MHALQGGNKINKVGVKKSLMAQTFEELPHIDENETM